MTRKLFTSIILLVISAVLCGQARADLNRHTYRHAPAELDPDAPQPVYFEESWAILSSIGIINVTFGLIIIGIIDISPIATVPIVVSAAGAVANGLCYYAFYANYAIANRVAAAAIGDVAWMIQEAGMSFYSYLILIKVLRNRPRLIFLSLFWSLMVIILVLRMLILVTRANDLLNGTTSLQSLVNRLHVAYFSSLAVVECISTFFLLRKFITARKTSLEASNYSGIFPYLVRSTEMRLGTLAIVGITRAITYSWQTTEQSATSVSGQVDRFVYTVECMFPVMMFIDILGTRSIVTNNIQKSRSPLSVNSSRRRRHSSLGGQVGSSLRSWHKPETSGVPSTFSEEIIHENSGETVEGQKVISGFNFSFETQDTGISRTVDFKPYG